MKSNIFVKYGYRQHRGSLQDSLLTKVYITATTFNMYVTSGAYTYYGFDKRCNQFLWLCNNGSQWIFIEVEVINEE